MSECLTEALEVPIAYHTGGVPSRPVPGSEAPYRGPAGDVITDRWRTGGERWRPAPSAAGCVW